MPTVKYNNYLEINPNFESVVDIDADKRNHNLWREYIVGDDMENLVEFLCESLGNEAPDLRRSFWIHGSYGTGKSMAAILVKHLIEEKPEVIDAFLASSARLSKFRNRFAKCRKNGDYLVVWKTGCTGIRSGDMMLLEAEKAIQDALVEKYGDKAYLGERSLISAVKAKLDDPSINWDYLLESTSLGDDYGSVDSLRQDVADGKLSALQATASVIRSKGYGLFNNLETFKDWIADIIEGNHLERSGIFFIWDEFTEYVVHSDDHTVMQQISEFCKVQPFFMFYVVHKSQEMVDTLGNDRYQLITNRFHQVEFHVSPDAAFDLIAGSITTRTGMEENWKEARKQVLKVIKPALPDMSGLDDKIGEMIDDLCPMHPMTIKLLSRVAESFAAAQRTMFRFMKDQSNEEIGFIGYINKYGPDSQACWLTPDWLWDYFFTRESDFREKDTKAAEYIRHFEDNQHLVNNDENAFRVFKIGLLLMAVMSTTRGIYGGVRAHGGIASTVDCLKQCLAGVISSTQIDDILDTLQDSKVLLVDEALNGEKRLQLPFRTIDNDEFDARYKANDKKYSRYQLFTKDGVLSSEFEKQAWDENDATKGRIKLCVCCAETNSINNRLEEIKKELDKSSYKIGVLVVTVQNDAQFLSIQNELSELAVKTNEPRLVIAAVKKPFSDDARNKWLKAVTNQEIATLRGQTASASIHKSEAATIVSSWIGDAVNGSKINAWNGNTMFSNLFGTSHLRKTVKSEVLERIFPFAPESVCTTNTAYKSCNDAAPLVGITRSSNNAQTKNVLNMLQNAGVSNLTTINEMASAEGNKASIAVAALAKCVRNEMESGQRVILSELWQKLQQPPFGYYNTIVCGVLLGFVFSCYKDSAYSWTDNTQSTHVLGEATLKTMVLSMCKGGLTTDYLSAGSVAFQNFRKYIQKIMALSDAQVANETECVRNMREAVVHSGAPLWALKYISSETFGSADFATAAASIVDSLQDFVTQDVDREGIMSEVLQLFNGRGKLRKILENAFQDKTQLSTAFRTFLFSASPELKEIATQLMIKPEELSDKVCIVMQDAIYTWTEDQVKEKLPSIVSEYTCLASLNDSMGKVYHSIEGAQKDLANLFKFLRIPVVAIDKLNDPWVPALKIMYEVSQNGLMQVTAEDRAEYATMLSQYGKNAMDCLKDAHSVLAEILDSNNEEYTQTELDSIYSGLRDISCDTSLNQFEKELKNQVSQISYARNRTMLIEKWRTLTGTDTVRAWCSQHKAPIFWIVGKQWRNAISTVVDIQNGDRRMDTEVQNALKALSTIDQNLLNDDSAITTAFLNVVGKKYESVFSESLDYIITQAKLKIGNDMSQWEAADLVTVQKIADEVLAKKAREEKYAKAESDVHEMNEDEMRSKILDFLKKHPEFCDDFMG